MGLNRRQRMQKAPKDRKAWQKYYYKYQKSYQRRRLEAIKMLWDGDKLVDVCFKLGCDRKTLRVWIDSYLSGGFEELLIAKKSGKQGTGQLSKPQLRLLKFIILHKSPEDYGLESYRWTLNLVGKLLKDKWKIELKKSQIQYILTEELNLSYQKFHRDYANADKGAQKAFARDLHSRMEEQQADEAIVWFDEFSISTRPDAAYGWAEKNTSPTVPSNEKKENAKMDF